MPIPCGIASKAGGIEYRGKGVGWKRLGESGVWKEVCQVGPFSRERRQWGGDGRLEDFFVAAQRTGLIQGRGDGIGSG